MKDCERCGRPAERPEPAYVLRPGNDLAKPIAVCGECLELMWSDPAAFWEQGWQPPEGEQ